MYYHVTTQKSWGKKVTLKPRHAGGHCPTTEAPTTKRISVGPTPIHCLIALGNVIDDSDVRVYGTDVAPSSDYCCARDSHITHEKWITEPAEFYYLFTIRQNTIHEWGIAELSYLGSEGAFAFQLKAIRFLLGGDMIQVAK